MVACILEHNGRVDKYMGDAILASFGAPLPTPDHAGDAVRCALAMREALREFNAELAAEDIPPVRIGVGVNTGPVIIGNIGSADRLEYTIIGDTVNRTKRIEDLTKELGWDILIGETTYLDVQDIAGVGPPRMVTMRGHTGVTAVYPLLGLREDMAGQAGAA
jgi:adenylate cyclase